MASVFFIITIIIQYYYLMIFALFISFYNMISNNEKPEEHKDIFYTFYFEETNK